VSILIILQYYCKTLVSLIITMSDSNKKNISKKRKEVDIEANGFAPNQHPTNAAPSTGHKTPDDQMIGDLGVDGGKAVLLVGGQSSAESKVTPADTTGQARLKKLFGAKQKSPPKSVNCKDPDPDLDVIQPLIDKEIKPLIKEGKIEECVEGSENHLMLIFLFARGVPQYLEENKKTKEKAELFIEILTEGTKGRERLVQLMKLGTDHDAGKDHHPHCPDTWLPKYPFNSDSGLQQWVPGSDGDNNSNGRLLTIFNAFEPNQAKQCSANCYLVAATTCYAYAVKRETDEWRKVDVATYIRYAFSPKRLYDRIVRNKGGNAIDVFEDLSEHPRSKYEEIPAYKDNITIEDYFQCLGIYGAGLVTKFHVDSEFRNSSNFTHTGSVDLDTSKATGHAMVLVGVREDKSGQGWLLLQNWWEGRQFLEMTLEYMKSSNAVLFFTQSKHTKVREPLDASSTNHLYTEVDFDDGGDEDDDDEDDYVDEADA
jgi:hypothetical protein